MPISTYFVFDSETGYILSGFDCCDDNHNDGYNIYTRPYTNNKFHSKNEKCRLDYIYNTSRRTGLPKLKYNNLKVAKADNPFVIKSDFVKNPNYLNERYAVSGWWKLNCANYTVI